MYMKKRILSLLCAAALVAGLSVPAMAAEGSSIQVQLNGQNLTFTDAVPAAKDGRVYLPFRTVFEALGATVGSDAAAGTVTAIRDGRTLTMTIGSTSATMLENGKTTSLVMDAAPYVQDRRTYVPIRFAAQAFDCAVGWDSAARTAVVVDAQKAVADALAGSKYTLLDKLAAYNATQATGNQAMTGTAKVNIDALGGNLLTGDCATTGVISKDLSFQADFDMKMDATGLYTLMGALGLNTSTATEADKKVTVKMDMRGDVATGKLYYLMSGLPNAASGVPDGSWLLMDMNKTAEQAGVTQNVTALPDFTSQAGREKLLTAALSGISVNDSATAYTVITAGAKGGAAALSDESFKKVTGGYTNSISMNENGADITVDFNLSTNAAGEVTGYAQNVKLTVDVKAMAQKDAKLKETLDQFAAMGYNADTLTANLNLSSQNAKNAKAQVSLSLGTLFSADIDVDVALTPTTKVPQSTPPAGANIVDYAELMASQSK